MNLSRDCSSSIFKGIIGNNPFQNSIIFMDTNQELLDILKNFNDLDHKTDLKRIFQKFEQNLIENLQYLFFESSCFKDIEYFHKGVSTLGSSPLSVEILDQVLKGLNIPILPTQSNCGILILGREKGRFEKNELQLDMIHQKIKTRL